MPASVVGAPARNTARYCDGLDRQFCVRFPGAGINGDRWAAVGGQTCLDPLDCAALTEDEARAAGEAWAAKRTTRIGTDLSQFYRIEPLPAGWSNDGAPAPTAEVSAYEVDRAEAIHGLGQKSDAELRTLADHFRKVAPLAKLASNRQSSEALVAACERLIARRGAMIPQPCQQQQAKARPRAQQPARGERRYVTVRDTETGELHRVLTSIARVGVAVVIFTPSNRHRQGALGGMLITHDDIRKAWVFNDEAEARRMLSRNGAPGERVIRAELISDPAAA